MKLEPDFSEGSVSYNPDGTLNRAETKTKLGAHSATASLAALYAKVIYGANISIATMGPPIADMALSQAQLLCDADELHLYSDSIFASADTLATAEVLSKGINKMNNGNPLDIVFSGHRASDGETGQTGPQTAWKLGYPFLGNVVDYHIDLESKTVFAKRLISLFGMYDILEEVRAPLPVFISVDPSYQAIFSTVSQRLKLLNYKNEARKRYENYKQYLRIFDHKSLELDPNLVGLSGSPTIVHRVEKIPKVKTNRIGEIVDGSSDSQMQYVVEKITQLTQKIGGI